MSTTTDPTTPCIREIEPETGMQKCYLVLSPEEITKGFVRPVRTTYQHITCGVRTSMGQAIAETYARDPKFYGGTYCSGCGTHFPLVDDNGVRQFKWVDRTNTKDESFVGE